MQENKSISLIDCFLIDSTRLERDGLAGYFEAGLDDNELVLAAADNGSQWFDEVVLDDCVPQAIGGEESLVLVAVPSEADILVCMLLRKSRERTSPLFRRI